MPKISHPTPINLAEATPSLLLRICRKVVVNRETQCWVWTGALNDTKSRKDGRPVIQLGRFGSRVVLVTRVLLYMTVGPPPDGLAEACHTCPKGENHKCVNPDHLQWGSRMENEQMKQRRTA